MNAFLVLLAYAGPGLAGKPEVLWRVLRHTIGVVAAQVFQLRKPSLNAQKHKCPKL